MSEDETEPTASGVPAEPRQDSARIVRSEDLLLGQREIIIRHGGEDYRLRLTRAGKLILNK